MTKRELASHFGRSERWVELKARDCGLPVHSTDRFGKKRYDVKAVEAWMYGEQAKPPRDRVGELEARVEELSRVVAELRRAS